MIVSSMSFLQRPTRIGGAAVVAAALVAACETRNPYEVSKQRQQQSAAAPDVAASPAASTSPAAAPPRLLPEAIEAKPLATEPVGAVKIEVARAVTEQTLMIRANDSMYLPRMTAIYDGDTTTLARSEEVNPLILSLEFASAIRLVAVLIFPSYSSYDWGVEPTPGKPSVAVRNVSADTWS